MTAHAAAEFILQNPNMAGLWNEYSKNIVCLQTKNEQSLTKLAQQLANQSIPVTMFNEPDLNNELVTVAAFLSPQAATQVKNLMLANPTSKT